MDIDTSYAWHKKVLKQPLDGHPVAEIPGAQLYVRQYPGRVPAWSKYFPKQPAAKVKNSSTAGLLLFSVRGKAVAVCFGLGRHLLISEYVEESFGLKTTVNLIGADRVRSIDKVTFDQITRHSRVQATQQGDAAAFQVNVDQDIVCAVTGVPESNEFGPRIAGRDSLKLTVELNGLEDLPALVTKLLRAHRAKAYKKSFPWIDHVSEVKKRSLLVQLQRALEKSVASKQFDRLWMCTPEIVDWERVDGFKYSDSSKADLVDELDFVAFLETCKRRISKAAITVDYLQQRRIYACVADGDRAHSPWSAYKCIYFETEIDGDTYLLNAGRWFRVAKGYVDRVNKYVSSIQGGAVPLPPWKRGEKEGRYNKRAVTRLGTNATLLDAKNLSYGGGHSKVEFCDIMTKSPGRLIFVKKYSQSASLSHLFSQALVSSRLLKMDSDFRVAVQDKLPNGFVLGPAAKLTAQWEICLVIITKTPKPLVLPFFSRITLMVAHQEMLAMGYSVSLQQLTP